MQITLYKTTSEKNRLNKTLTNATVLQGYLKQDCSMLNPHIIIEHTNPAIFNECNIQDFDGRFYYIEDIINLSQNRWELVCKVDVLQTYGQTIKNLTCIIDKSEIVEDTYFDDGSRVINCKRQDEIKQFQDGFSNTPNFVLIVAGG